MKYVETDFIQIDNSTKQAQLIRSIIPSILASKNMDVYLTENIAEVITPRFSTKSYSVYKRGPVTGPYVCINSMDKDERYTDIVLILRTDYSPEDVDIKTYNENLMKTGGDKLKKIKIYRFFVWTKRGFISEEEQKIGEFSLYAENPIGKGGENNADIHINQLFGGKRRNTKKKRGKKSKKSKTAHKK